ncbi:MAG: 6-phosphofructokinase [Oscillospiraceae bacterium]|nr:6-phosphofructokinase [Oscillospiraceae bacterium]
MSELKGTCIFGQSGGPTSVINASAAGVFQEALATGCITGVYGAVHGIKGILNEVLYDIGKESASELNYLRSTPSSALGSVRYKLKHYEDDESDYIKILDVFRKHNVRYFFYNGGNDSMDTCNKVNGYLKSVGYECRVMGVPKTIDNDLWGTDHCPGFGSAAKFVATSMMEVYLDARVYGDGMVTVFEVMGRNAGWLTAAAALATHKGAGPDLIYIPENSFDLNKFMSDVEGVYSATGQAMIAVSEGIRGSDGTYFAEIISQDLSKDSFGHLSLGGIANFLAGYIRPRLNVKVRAIDYNLLQRCASHCASETDVEEAYLAGKMAVKYAVEGHSGYMVAFERDSTAPEYKCATKLVDLTETANKEKTIPREWINDNENGVRSQFIDYALPLIAGEPHFPTEDGLPRFTRLNKIRL